MVDNADRGYQYSVSEAEELTGITQQQVSRWRKRLQDRAAYSTVLFGAAYKKAFAERGQTDQRGASGTGDNEWYTPNQYVEAVRQLYDGTIDLDAASNEHAQETIRAESYFTRADDALAQEWHGRVWLNPPYAQPAIAHFVEKLVSECRFVNGTQMPWADACLNDVKDLFRQWAMWATEHPAGKQP